MHLHSPCGLAETLPVLPAPRRHTASAEAVGAGCSRAMEPAPPKVMPKSFRNVAACATQDAGTGQNSTLGLKVM